MCYCDIVLRSYLMALKGAQNLIEIPCDILIKYKIQPKIPLQESIL